MNIIEAIKSGKKYRRIGERDWYESGKIEIDYSFPVRAVIANDWEVEEISCYAGSAMITREDLDRAWKAALTVDELAKELGL